MTLNLAKYLGVISRWVRMGSWCLSRWRLLHGSQWAGDRNSACGMTAPQLYGEYEEKKRLQRGTEPHIYRLCKGSASFGFINYIWILLLVLEVYWLPKNVQRFRNDFGISWSYRFVCGSVINMHTKIITNVNSTHQGLFWEHCQHLILMHVWICNEGNWEGQSLVKL